MAKVVVTYTAKFHQIIDWPDDELDDFNLQNLECNIEPEKSDFIGDIDVVEINLNGKEHYF
jgi:hypothetical protein